MKKNAFLLTIILATLYSCKDDEVSPGSIVENFPISALTIDNSNTLWIGTSEGLIKGSSSGYKFVDIKNNAAITALAFEEINNTLWVGTNKGLSQLSLNGNSEVSEKIPNDSLSNKSINSVFVDLNSAKWYGTDSGITRNNFTIWQREKFKKNLSGTITAAVFEKFRVNSIAAWDGDYYFATNGHSVYRTSNWNESVDAFSGASQLLNPYNGFGLTDTMYVVFIDSKGQQWFGGREGIQVHTGHNPKEENVAFYDELVNPVVHCVSEAPDGKIWVGTENGISIYDGINWSVLTANLPDRFITAIVFEIEGKAWIGTKKGLVSID